MSLKPSYKCILLTLSFLSQLINCQTGEGCANRYTPCEEGQVRRNAMYHPTTNVFIGGCNCGCDLQARYDPTSPLYCPLPKQINFDPITITGDCSCHCPSSLPQPNDCKLPQIYNYQTCRCQCPNQLSATNCPLYQMYNFKTCQCECPGLGAPGYECLNQYFEAIPNSKILSDCSCQCPDYAPSKHDCQAIGREYNLCQCLCPINCPYANQILNQDMCHCSCPICPQGEILLNEVSCQCGAAGTPVEIQPNEIVQYCCQPLIDNFVPYFGRCWGITNDIECANEIRCKWDVSNCFNEKPSCSFRDYTCTTNSECCSHVCKSEGLCR
eukprot:68169_1